jgi:hypothetical protein
VLPTLPSQLRHNSGIRFERTNYFLLDFSKANTISLWVVLTRHEKAKVIGIYDETSPPVDAEHLI